MNIQVLKGSLLGDMWIQKHKSGPKSYSICYEQSEFLYSKWKADMCGIPYTLTKNKRLDKRTDKTYYRYYVYLKLDKENKNNLYHEFYFPKKEVTTELLNSLTPLAIAIWFMDDGNMYYNGNNCHLNLAVNGFNDNSIDNIINYFNDVHQIKFKRSGRAIRVTSVRESKLFMNIVEKYIPKCMKRKTLSYQRKRYDKTLSNEQRKCRQNKYK